jgi:hypothetical protein
MVFFCGHLLNGIIQVIKIKEANGYISSQFIGQSMYGTKRKNIERKTGRYGLSPKARSPMIIQ